MSALLRIAVKKYCDELSAHDPWMWGNTGQAIMRDVDYLAPCEIAPGKIIATMKDGRKIELCRSKDGWSIGYENKVTK